MRTVTGEMPRIRPIASAELPQGVCSTIWRSRPVSSPSPSGRKARSIVSPIVGPPGEGLLIVRARLASLEGALAEAAADLYATPFATFRKVTLPLIAPAVLAGFLPAFTFSFDDFIIAFLVGFSETKLPIYVFSAIRRGVTPEINAIGTMVLGASLVLLIIAQLILRREERK